MVTEVNEDIQVCAHFREGRLFPLWFVWHSRFYKVTSVTSRWSSREGRAAKHHLTVLAGGTCELYELCFDTERLAWSLGRIASAA